MQSRRSESMGAFLNPTILAMVGSAGVHGLLVLISVLRPAEGQPNALRIVNIAPQGNTLQAQKPGALAVPNDLPPINLGKVPQLPAAPDLSIAKVPPSQSVYLGSPANAVGKLPIYNVPFQSFPGSAVPGVGQSNLPNSIWGGVNPSGSTGTLRTPIVPSTSAGAGPDNFRVGETPPNRTEYAAPQSSTLPQLSAGDFQNNDLYARSTPLESPTNTPNTGPDATQTGPISVGATSDQARGQFKTWLQAQSQRYGQNISAQTGPRLRADYPPEACTSRQEGVAVVSGVYGPDGSILNSVDAVQVLQSAENMTLNRAAIAEVQRYRASAAGVYQAFNFTVDVPYSAKVCQGVEPEPSPTSTTGTQSTASPSISPQPSNTPTSQPAAPETPLAPSKASPKSLERTIPKDVEPTPLVQPSPISTLSPNLNRAPEPTVTGSPEPSPSPSPSLDALPSPEIAPSEPSPKN